MELKQNALCELMFSGESPYPAGKSSIVRDGNTVTDECQQRQSG